MTGLPAMVVVAVVVVPADEFPNTFDKRGRRDPIGELISAGPVGLELGSLAVTADELFRCVVAAGVFVNSELILRVNVERNVSVPAVACADVAGGDVVDG